MADLLIKGMNLPEEDRVALIAVFSSGDVKYIDRETFNSFYLPQKAQELPPHGEKCCGNCKWCHEGHYEEEGEQPYIKRKCTNKYGLTPNYSVYEHDYCSRWEASK